MAVPLYDNVPTIAKNVSQGIDAVADAVHSDAGQRVLGFIPGARDAVNGAVDTAQSLNNQGKTIASTLSDVSNYLGKNGNVSNLRDGLNVGLGVYDKLQPLAGLPIAKKFETM